MILVFLYICHALEQRSPLRSPACEQGEWRQPQKIS
jgi:hypothetical protein